MPVTRLIVFLLVCIFGFGCSTSNRADSEHIHLFTTGPIRVDVSTFAGDVILKEIEGYRGTSVEIRRLSATPLNLVRGSSWIQSSAYTNHHVLGEEVVVEVINTERLYRKKHLQIIVTTSGFTSVQIDTARGNIDATCGSIPMKIKTSDGDVFVAVTEPMTKNIAVTNKRGDIYLNILPNSSGILSATALGGESVLNATVGHVVLLAGTTKELLFATLNNGENIFSLNTVDGNVHVTVTEHLESGRTWSLDDWLYF